MHKRWTHLVVATLLLAAPLLPHHHHDGCEAAQPECSVCLLVHGGMELAVPPVLVHRSPAVDRDPAVRLDSQFVSSVDRQLTGSPRAPPAS